MQWINNIVQKRRAKANDLFLQANDDRARKDYGSAYANYMKAYSLFAKNNYQMKRSALESAEFCANKLGDEETAGTLAYRASIIAAKLNAPHREILALLQRSGNLKQRTNAKDTSTVIFFQLLFALAVRDFDLARKTANRAGVLTDNYAKVTKKLWDQVISREKLADEKELPFELKMIPEEFRGVIDDARSVMRAYSAMEVSIDPVSSTVSIEHLKTLKVTGQVTSHADNVQVSAISLVTGNKGVLVGDKREMTSSFSINHADKHPITFWLEPKIAGEWEIGPIKVSYTYDGTSYDIYSDVVKTTVLEPKGYLDLQLASECFEEDFGYTILAKLSNKSKALIDNITVNVLLPAENVEKTEGTLEKQLSSLSSGEEFQFDVGVKFLVSTKKQSYKIKVIAKFGDMSVTKILEIPEASSNITHP